MQKGLLFMNNFRHILPLLYDYYLVCKEMSYTKAAEKYLLSQSNLSRSIKNLENDLGLILLNRNNKGIVLTSVGKELYNKLDIFFNSFSYDNNKLKNSKLSGTLTIGTTRNIADNKLSKYILKLTKLYPEISVKVWIDNASNLSEMLKKHTIDVLIDYLPFKNDYENKDVIIQKIDSFKTFFACNKNFYEKEKNNIKKISDLNNYNLIIPGSSRRRDILENLLQQVNVKLVAKIQIPDSKLMADLVLNSNYIGYFIEEEINLYNLAKIHLNVETPDNEIGLIYYKSSVSEETSKLIEIILE